MHIDHSHFAISRAEVQTTWHEGGHEIGLGVGELVGYIILQFLAESFSEVRRIGYYAVVAAREVFGIAFEVFGLIAEDAVFNLDGGTFLGRDFEK